jgi:hypothetical protein
MDAEESRVERTPLLFIAGAMLYMLRDDKTRAGQVQSRLLPPYSPERDAICFAVVQFRHAAQKTSPGTPCDCCLFFFQQLNKMLHVFSRLLNSQLIIIIFLKRYFRVITKISFGSLPLGGREVLKNCFLPMRLEEVLKLAVFFACGSFPLRLCFLAQLPAR